MPRRLIPLVVPRWLRLVLCRLRLHRWPPERTGPLRCCYRCGRLERWLLGRGWTQTTLRELGIDRNGGMLP